MTSVADIIVAAVIVAVVLLDIRYIFRTKKNKKCIGCSKESCNSSHCDGCSG